MIAQSSRLSQIPNIADLLDPAKIIRLQGKPSKPLVISALADIATADLQAHDRISFIRSVLEREDVTTTALGDGVAIPHARSPAVNRCRIAVATIPSGVSWDAMDGKLVTLALLIAAREVDHAEHLRVMAMLAKRLRQPGLAALVCSLTDAEAIRAAILGQG